MLMKMLFQSGNCENWVIFSSVKNPKYGFEYQVS